MLTVEFEPEQDGITVPYPPLFDDIRRNFGFLDLRGRPDLVGQIPECSQSPALRALLVDLSHEEAVFFSVGCDLGSHEEPRRDENSRYAAGGYLQVMHRSYAHQTHEEYMAMGREIAQKLEKQAQNYDWITHFVPSFVQFNLDDFSDLTSSLWIWFWAIASSAQAALTSREKLLSELRRVLMGKSQVFWNK